VRRQRGKRGHILREARTAAVMATAAALGTAIGFHAAEAQTREPSRVLLQADEITYDTAAGLVTARGHVEISDDQRTLLANEVVYNENANTVTATGNVSLQDATTGNVAFADSVELTQDLREGALKGFAALVGQNRPARRLGRRAARGPLHPSPMAPCSRLARSARTRETACRCGKSARRGSFTISSKSKSISKTPHSIYLGVPVFYCLIFRKPTPV